MISEKEIIDVTNEDFEPKSEMEAFYAMFYAIIAADDDVTDAELEFLKETIEEIAKNATSKGAMTETELTQFSISKEEIYNSVAKWQKILGSEKMIEKCTSSKFADLENFTEDVKNNVLALLGQLYFSDQKWWSDIGELSEELVPDDYLERKKDKTIDAIYFLLLKLNIEPSRFKKAFDEGRYTSSLAFGIRRAKKERVQKEQKVIQERNFLKSTINLCKFLIVICSLILLGIYKSDTLDETDKTIFLTMLPIFIIFFLIGMFSLLKKKKLFRKENSPKI